MAEVHPIRPMDREEWTIARSTISTIQIIDAMFAAEGRDVEYSSLRLKKVAEEISVRVSQWQIDNLLVFAKIIDECCGDKECIDAEFEIE